MKDSWDYSLHTKYVWNVCLKKLFLEIAFLVIIFSKMKNQSTSHMPEARYALLQDEFMIDPNSLVGDIYD